MGRAAGRLWLVFAPTISQLREHLPKGYARKALKAAPRKLYALFPTPLADSKVDC